MYNSTSERGNIDAICTGAGKLKIMWLCAF